MKVWRSPGRRFVLTLAISTLVSLGLFAYGAWRNHSLAYDYLSWNLLLAWLPLLFALGLMRALRRKAWSSWEGIGWSLLWLLFLPNSFYMITDFVHIQDVQRVDVLYDTLMFTSFICTGAVLGFSSLYLIHRQLRRRLKAAPATIWVGAILVVCSVAMYTGRDLRWNSWDVLTNPGGLLVDLSNRLLHPSAYPQMLTAIVAFSVLLASLYGLVWQGARLLSQTGAEQGIKYITFYGTLRRSGQTTMHPLIREHLTYVGSCRIPGDLYNLGRLVAVEPGDHTVTGDLYRLKDMEILPALDDYEAVDNVDPQLPAFSRQLVRLANPKVEAWVYFYDGAVNDEQQITPNSRAAV